MFKVYLHYNKLRYILNIYFPFDELTFVYMIYKCFN